MNADDDLLDQIDEELELDLTDDVLGRALPAPYGGDARGVEADEEPLDRRVYMKELFRLQRELVKLQDSVVKDQNRDSQ